jgi:hypothetical protein
MFDRILFALCFLGISATHVGGVAVSRVKALRLEVPRDSVGTFRVFVSAPPSRLDDKKMPLRFILGASVETETLFTGP